MASRSRLCSSTLWSNIAWSWFLVLHDTLQRLHRAFTCTFFTKAHHHQVCWETWITSMALVISNIARHIVLDIRSGEQRPWTFWNEQSDTQLTLYARLCGSPRSLFLPSLPFLLVCPSHLALFDASQQTSHSLLSLPPKQNPAMLSLEKAGADFHPRNGAERSVGRSNFPL